MVRERKKVIVAMSGGVDSSVAAALLAEEHEFVIGVMLSMWRDPNSENFCSTSKTMEQSNEVASQLGIPFKVIDAKRIFREIVVESFIRSYKFGKTPNPCIICNRQVKWEILISYADEIGATHIATGHYARLRKDHANRTQLLKGKDRSKDQSYVLYSLSQETLSKTIFPVGDYQKSEIRLIAKNLTLPVSERPDSQDLCFVGNQGYRDFLVRYAPEVQKPGPIISTNGIKVGEHQGLAFYTIGQRKGLGISADQPYYVIEKDIQRNTIMVGRKVDLGKDETKVEEIKWISGDPVLTPLQATIKIRYKAQEVGGWINPIDENQAFIKFDRPIQDITPGQSAVFYNDEVCLGGGIIT